MIFPSGIGPPEKKGTNRAVIIFWSILVSLTGFSTLMWGRKAIIGGLIVAFSLVVNGFLAEWEDRQPGGFSYSGGSSIQPSEEKASAKILKFVLFMSSFCCLLASGAYVLSAAKDYGMMMAASFEFGIAGVFMSYLALRLKWGYKASHMVFLLGYCLIGFELGRRLL